MTKPPKDNSVGPWAKEKLDALGQYLDFYTKVLKNQGRWLQGTIFVDAFAGPGLAWIRPKSRPTDLPQLFRTDAEPDAEEIEYLKGSPRVALDIPNPFTSYVFIEKAPKRIAELNALKEAYGDNRAIVIQEGDANTAIKDWLASGIDWTKYRAVVFLDPFGMQVSWSTIEQLAKTKGIEVIINFPLAMAVQRLLTRSGEIPQDWQASLDDFFGSKEWRTLAYEERSDLFGPKTHKADNSGAKLLEWYRIRLRVAFGLVSTARLIKNTRGNPLYYLVWAGHHKKGLEGAEYILSKGERIKN